MAIGKQDVHVLRKELDAPLIANAKTVEISSKREVLALRYTKEGYVEEEPCPAIKENQE